ncbi:hypothetical protein VTJ04DRAFT_1171 [Mycothermus thermophilus]|uniref:uncharacterized protein n=1 Tax=Humicola insolens TaxID=85995 RepID=UPI003743E71B
MIALCSRDGCSFLCLLLLALVLRIDGYFEPIFIAYEKGKREWQRKKQKRTDGGIPGPRLALRCLLKGLWNGLRLLLSIIAGR